MKTINTFNAIEIGIHSCGTSKKGKGVGASKVGAGATRAVAKLVGFKLHPGQRNGSYAVLTQKGDPARQAIRNKYPKVAQAIEKLGAELEKMKNVTGTDVTNGIRKAIKEFKLPARLQVR